MIFHRAGLENCSGATGAVVVIDVIRAFTTAAVAFSRGANEIVLVSEVSEALELRARDPALKIMGEVNGAKPPEFDFSNSPAQLDRQDLAGRTLVHRTTAGTQGMVRSRTADTLLASSLVCAAATARYLKAIQAPEVTFVITGRVLGLDGDEDAACADVLESLLLGRQPDHDAVRERVLSSTWGRRFGATEHPELPGEDIDYFLDFDRFDFAMVASRRKDQLVLTRVPV